MASEEVGQVHGFQCFNRFLNVNRLFQQTSVAVGPPSSKRLSFFFFFGFLLLIFIQNRLILRRPFVTHSAILHSLPNLAYWVSRSALHFAVLATHHFLSSAAYWCERPEYFAAIADAKPGYDRAIAVLRWFIVRVFPFLTTSPIHLNIYQSTLRDQYTSRNDELGSEKKYGFFGAIIC